MGKAEQTRQRIIEKSAPLFNKKGYLGTSISDLTKSTGLTKGAIYGNFKNKNEIALEAFEFNIGKVIGDLMKDVTKSNDAIDMLMAIADFFLHNAIDIYKRGGCPIVNAAADSDDTNLLLNKKVKEKIEGLKSMIVQIINEGIKKGRIIPSVNSPSFASVAISLIEGGSLLSKTTGDMEFLRNSINQLKALVMTIKKQY
jgi:TetR/AcrR family transcriptional regulator, transcriptional repressor for nem operon